MDDDQGFFSYNGLGRVPTIMGIPLMAGMLLFVFSSALSILAFSITNSIFGLLFGVIIAAPVFIYLRINTDLDDQFIQINAIEIKWWFLKKIKNNSFQLQNNHEALTFMPVEYGRKLRDVRSYFKEFESFEDIVEK